MKKISHSKYKNTGLIFEILVRKLTNESISKNSPISLNIIKKFFVNSELQKENKLYQLVSQNNNLSESKSKIILNTIYEINNKLDQNKLNKEKYNLIKEIKNQYNIDSFFQTNIPQYKTLASIYTVLESLKYDNPNVDQIIESKSTILEHLTSKPITSEIYKEMSKLDKGERSLVYKLMVEKFNEKFVQLNNSQKLILKEYISSMSNNDSKFTSLVVKEFKNTKKSILENLNQITSDVVKIKINNILSYIDPILESTKITDDNLIMLFQFQELNEELSKT